MDLTKEVPSLIDLIEFLRFDNFDNGSDEDQLLKDVIRVLHQVLKERKDDMLLDLGGTAMKLTNQSAHSIEKEFIEESARILNGVGLPINILQDATHYSALESLFKLTSKYVIEVLENAEFRKHLGLSTPVLDAKIGTGGKE